VIQQFLPRKERVGKKVSPQQAARPKTKPEKRQQGRYFLGTQS